MNLSIRTAMNATAHQLHAAPETQGRLRMGVTALLLSTAFIFGMQATSAHADVIKDNAPAVGTALGGLLGAVLGKDKPWVWGSVGTAVGNAAGQIYKDGEITNVGNVGAGVGASVGAAVMQKNPGIGVAIGGVGGKIAGDMIGTQMNKDKKMVDAYRTRGGVAQGGRFGDVVHTSGVQQQGAPAFAAPGTTSLATNPQFNERLNTSADTLVKSRMNLNSALKNYDDTQSRPGAGGLSDMRDAASKLENANATYMAYLHDYARVRNDIAKRGYNTKDVDARVSTAVNPPALPAIEQGAPRQHLAYRP
jgi:hypothetical protein